MYKLFDRDGWMVTHETFGISKLLTLKYISYGENTLSVGKFALLIIRANGWVDR